MQRIRHTNELIEWFNGKLEMEYKQLSEFRTGAAVCHLFHMLHPNSSKLWRVNFDANATYQYIQNWKLLQQMFNTLHIKREFSIESLVAETNTKRDMLNFLQWCRLYFDKHKPVGTGGHINAAEERARAREKRTKNLSNRNYPTGSIRDSGSDSGSLPSSSSHGSSGSRASTQTHPHPNYTAYWKRRRDHILYDKMVANVQRKRANSGPEESDTLCSKSLEAVQRAVTSPQVGEAHNIAGLAHHHSSRSGSHGMYGASSSPLHGLWILANWPSDPQFDASIMPSPKVWCWFATSTLHSCC